MSMDDNIKKCNQMHDEAMALSDQAFAAQKQNDSAKAVELFEKAFCHEREAAMVLESKHEIEPSRSVLFRSAAWLAIHAGLPREAMRMAAFGLSGTPPLSIEKELREVMGKSLQLLESSVTA